MTPSYGLCYFTIAKNVKAYSSWSIRRIGMKLTGYLHYDVKLQFMTMTLTLLKGQGHMTLIYVISKISIFQMFINLSEFWFFCTKDNYMFVIFCKFHNHRLKTKAVMTSQTYPPVQSEEAAFIPVTKFCLTLIVLVYGWSRVLFASFLSLLINIFYLWKNVQNGWLLKHSLDYTRLD